MTICDCDIAHDADLGGLKAVCPVLNLTPSVFASSTTWTGRNLSQEQRVHAYAYQVRGERRGQRLLPIYPCCVGEFDWVHEAGRHLSPSSEPRVGSWPST